MIFDANCQFFGSDETGALLHSMDAAGIDKALLAASLEGAVIPGTGKTLARRGKHGVRGRGGGASRSIHRVLSSQSAHRPTHGRRSSATRGPDFAR